MPTEFRQTRATAGPVICGITAI